MNTIHKTRRRAVFAAVLAMAGAGALISVAAPAQAAPGQEFIVNGDFSNYDPLTGANLDGVTTTDFHLTTSLNEASSPNNGDMYDPGVYAIAVNPGSLHNQWVEYGGNNPKMVLNGFTEGTQTVWQQVADGVTCTTPGSTIAFTFTADVANVLPLDQYSDGGANIEVLINGLSIGSADLTSNDGTPVSISSASVPAADTFTIQIVNHATVYIGNDFSIDNLSLKQTGDCTAPATFAFPAPTAATCTAPGSLDLTGLGDRGNWTLSIDPTYTGPGMYTLTATAHAGFFFPAPGDPFVRSAQVTVNGQLTGGDCCTKYRVVTFEMPGWDPVVGKTFPQTLLSTSEPTCDPHFPPPPPCKNIQQDIYRADGPLWAAALADGILTEAEGNNPALWAEMLEGGSTNSWRLYKLDPATCIPVPVLFDVAPTPPTCVADGSFPIGTVFPIVRTGYTLTVNHPITDGPGVYIITATAATGYAFSGPGDPFVRTTTVTVKAKGTGLDCTTHVIAVFPVPTAPTCLAAGTLPAFPIDRVGYTLSISPTFTGPGIYTITATAKANYTLDGAKTSVVTVLPKDTSEECIPDIGGRTLGYYKNHTVTNAQWTTVKGLYGKAFPTPPYTALWTGANGGLTILSANGSTNNGLDMLRAQFLATSLNVLTINGYGAQHITVPASSAIDGGQTVTVVQYLQHVNAAIGTTALDSKAEITSVKDVLDAINQDAASSLFV